MRRELHLGDSSSLLSLSYSSPHIELSDLVEKSFSEEDLSSFFLRPHGPVPISDISKVVSVDSVFSSGWLPMGWGEQANPFGPHTKSLSPTTSLIKVIIINKSDIFDLHLLASSVQLSIWILSCQEWVIMYWTPSRSNIKNHNAVISASGIHFEAAFNKFEPLVQVCEHDLIFQMQIKPFLKTVFP